jgi:hypothetical protein
MVQMSQTDPKALLAIKVTGEVIDEVKGPKTDIFSSYKSKTDIAVKVFVC